MFFPFRVNPFRREAKHFSESCFSLECIHSASLAHFSVHVYCRWRLLVAFTICEYSVAWQYKRDADFYRYWNVRVFFHSIWYFHLRVGMRHRNRGYIRRISCNEVRYSPSPPPSLSLSLSLSYLFKFKKKIIILKQHSVESVLYITLLIFIIVYTVNARCKDSICSQKCCH